MRQEKQEAHVALVFNIGALHENFKAELQTRREQS